MEIPKYAERLIEQRTKQMILLSAACEKLDAWLDANHIECPTGDTHGGIDIYGDPEASAQRIRDAILATQPESPKN